MLRLIITVTASLLLLSALTGALVKWQRAPAINCPSPMQHMPLIEEPEVRWQRDV